MTENVNELEERARRMGLVWYKFVRGVIDIFIAKGGDVDCPEAWFPLAETLLAALDPKALKWKPSSSSMLPRPGYEYVIIERKVQE